MVTSTVIEFQGHGNFRKITSEHLFLSIFMSSLCLMPGVSKIDEFFFHFWLLVKQVLLLQ